MSVAATAGEALRDVEWGRPDWDGLRGRPERLESALAVVRSEIAAAGETSSFTFIAAVSGERAAVRARVAAASLLRSVTAGWVTDMARAAAALAGLGEGSTPAGDDFLVGVIYAIYATQPRARAAALGAAIAAAADPRTTRLSAQWLQRAAGGEAIPTWSSFFCAVAAGETRHIRESAGRVLSLGHTSGRAALAGFVAAAEALLGDRA